MLHTMSNRPYPDRFRLMAAIHAHGGNLKAGRALRVNPQVLTNATAGRVPAHETVLKMAEAWGYALGWLYGLENNAGAGLDSAKLNRLADAFRTLAEWPA